MDALRIVALLLAVIATVVGVTVFTRGAVAIVRTVRRGAPAPDRTDRPAARTWRVVQEVLGHTRFRSRPLVIAAHWAVMLSFPVLFLTLLGGYGQLVDPRFALPLIGHWPPLEWLVEAIAWASLLGIVALVVVRQREHPRRAGRGARFFGSNQGQAYVVEATIAVVVVCVLLLRGLEHALAATGSGARDAALATPLHFPLTAWYGQWLTALPTATLETAVVLVALTKILASMAWMVVVGRRPAMGVAWHRFLAVVNVWARREVDGGPALGALPPIRSGGRPVDLAAVEDLPEDARLGVGRLEDFSWKDLLDVATCTECGRCQEACPAWATGKVLSPKLVVQSLRDHAFATTPGLAVGPNGSTAPAGHTAATGLTPWPGVGGAGAVAGLDAATDAHAGLDVLTLVGDVVDPQALWDCTTCGACVQACPVDIEHVDHIVDLRRHQVLMASEFPAELAPMFTKLERQGNPWGLPARNRLEWAKGLPFPVPVVGVDVEDATEVDWLFWVGCAGAYEDRAKKTTRAVAELLHLAGVRFAVLGKGESCTGDPARRAGNEFLYQVLATGNVETLDAAKVHRIVATCAHCLNALGNEYPQLGGRYEVVHHTELLDQLVGEGRLVPRQRAEAERLAAVVREGAAADDGAGHADGGGERPVMLTTGATIPVGPAGDSADAPAAAPDAARTVTYHDPCYLGRHNGVYAPPRDLVRAIPGLELAEMPRSGERSFCCGGGGARAWMEESTGTRIGTERAAEAIATGASAVATGCPYCTIMIGDGVAAAGAAAGPDAAPGPEVLDVARLLLDAVRPDETPAKAAAP